MNDQRPDVEEMTEEMSESEKLGFDQFAALRDKILKFLSEELGEYKEDEVLGVMLTVCGEGIGALGLGCLDSSLKLVAQTAMFSAMVSKLGKGENAVSDDPTEAIRRDLTDKINAEQGSREALEAKHGQVWDTTELQRDFEVHSFAAPFTLVSRKSDGKKGTVMFQHSPRFYFGFNEA